MSSRDKVFKYGSKLFKKGIYFLIAGIVGFLVSFLLPNIAFFAGGGFGIGIGGIFGFIMCSSFYLVHYILFQSKYNWYSKNYNLNAVRAEMLEHSTSRCRGTYFTRNYIVNYDGEYLFICKYNELKWIYYRAYGLNGRVIVRRIVGFVGKNKYAEQIIVNYAGNSTLEEVFELIEPHNPNILVGHTKENKKEYKKQLKEQKSKGGLHE